jgi:hypothetical protein
MVTNVLNDGWQGLSGIPEVTDDERLALALAVLRKCWSRAIVGEQFDYVAGKFVPLRENA